MLLRLSAAFTLPSDLYITISLSLQVTIRIFVYAKILQNYSKEFIYLIIYINNKYRQQFTHYFSYCYLLLVTDMST